ncbi:hypothetical protein I3843_16G057400 [Carya illinoinensis]|nr:hypothetical protein I3843_16G057400 [Carya illinoinensis]
MINLKHLFVELKHWRTKRSGRSSGSNHYRLELIRVESPSFQRHNLAVCCSHGGWLFTLNPQAPESAWPGVKSDLHTMADSFIVLLKLHLLQSLINQAPRQSCIAIFRLPSFHFSF